jgi:hypothetical protein
MNLLKMNSLTIQVEYDWNSLFVFLKIITAYTHVFPPYKAPG